MSDVNINIATLADDMITVFMTELGDAKDSLADAGRYKVKALFEHIAEHVNHIAVDAAKGWLNEEQVKDMLALESQDAEEQLLSLEGIKQDAIKHAFTQALSVVHRLLKDLLRFVL